MKIVWECPECKDLKVSKSNERHQLDYCKCKKTGVDLESGYTRTIGKPMFLIVENHGVWTSEIKHQQRTILVTGGAGFIGHHCVRALLLQGHKVIVIDSFNDYYDPEIKYKRIEELELEFSNLECVNSDICNVEFLKNVLRQYSVDKILHLAAYAGVQPSFNMPLNYTKNNITGTMCVLEAARQVGIKNIVFASSSSVYGIKEGMFKEDQERKPLSPYGVSKKTCEDLAKVWHDTYGLNIIGLRYFTVYGPSNRDDMAISKFTKKLQNGEPIIVFDADEDIKRDWTYVEDVVEATLLALDKCSELKFEIFNIGSSNPVNVNKVVSLLAKELNVSYKTQSRSLPKGNPIVTYACNDKARELLGWSPKTSIEDGIKKFVERLPSQ